MTDRCDRIETHYTHGDLLARILTALEDAGHDSEMLSPDTLAPLDHLHTGGLASTKAQAEAVGFSSDDHILDLGSGIGGPARYLADK